MQIVLRDIKVNLPNGATLFRLSRMQIDSGQKILIKGESGRGKTTLLHLMAGLFKPTEGFVEMGENQLSEMKDEELGLFRRKNIGLIFQKLNLIEHLTATENVFLSIGGHGDSPARAAKALKAVGLSEHLNERSSVLSLGEQQRVAVARVLASDAKIILADEPTSSLDEKNAENVIDLLLQAAHGKTLVVVSHDHRIEKKFDRVVDFSELVHR